MPVFWLSSPGTSCRWPTPVIRPPRSFWTGPAERRPQVLQRLWAGMRLGLTVARALTQCSPGGPVSAVITGGLAAASSWLVEAFAQEVASLRPDVAVVEARGEPLKGALFLAREAAEGRAESQKGFLWKS